VRRLPFATVQNLTLVDRSDALSVYVGPGREATPAADVCVANHQDRPVPPEQERASATEARQRALRAEATVDTLLRPPVYVPFDGAFGTLYTAIYRPAEGRVSYVWPDARVEQSITNFTSGEWTVLR
jgi:predicted choloylglycine hydrolase